VPIECGDGLVTLAIVAHLDEPKASGLTAIAIRHDIDTPNGAVSFKQRAHGIFRGPKTEISYKDVLHAQSPFLI
jgi:hypothetical protein